MSPGRRPLPRRRTRGAELAAGAVASGGAAAAVAAEEAVPAEAAPAEAVPAEAAAEAVAEAAAPAAAARKARGEAEAEAEAVADAADVPAVKKARRDKAGKATLPTTWTLRLTFTEGPCEEFPEFYHTVLPIYWSGVVQIGKPTPTSR